MGGLKWVLAVGITASVFFIGTGQSRTETFTERYQAYQKLWPKTNLHLVLNQPKYAPGDTIWLKAYFLMENMGGVPDQQLIKIKLVDASGTIALSNIFEVINGIGHHAVGLPNTLPPGNYNLLAYNDWMKNFDPIAAFKKEIKIVGQNAIDGQRKPMLVAKAEGGHLLSGMRNKIGIYTGLANEAIDLYHEDGSKIESTVTDANGVAVVYISPAIGSQAKYTLKSATNYTNVTIQAQPNGHSLQMIELGNKNALRVEVIPTPNQPSKKATLSLVVSTRGQVYHTASFGVEGSEPTALLLPTANLPSGVLQLSLLDNEGKLVSHREFFHPGANQISATLKGGADQFKVRKKVELQVSLADALGKPVEGEFSVTVLNAKLFEAPSVSSFVDEMGIFMGRSEKFAIDRNTSDWAQSLDNYLIAMAMEVPWESILSKELSMLSALLPKTPEKLRNVMTKEILAPHYSLTGRIQKWGKAYDTDCNCPLPVGAKLVFYLQQSKMRYQTTVGDGGHFNLELLPVWGQDELFYVGEIEGMSVENLKIDWETDTMALPKAPAHATADSLDAYGAFAYKRAMIDQSYTVFELQANTPNSSDGRMVKTFEEEINGADDVYIVQDFLLFPTMKEFIKEVIKSVSVLRKAKRDAVRMKIYPLVNTGDPIYVIDGIVTDNTDFFLSLVPKDLVSIGLVNDHRKLVRFGALGKNGIIIVTTRAGNVREPLDEPAKIIEGLDPTAAFQPLDFAVEGSTQRPHFRSTIHWQPTIITGADGIARISFYTSDDIGPLRIQIDGLTSTGLPFSSFKVIEVVY